MPPSLATLLWFILTLVLFRLDPAKDRDASPALWIPTAWIFFTASRLPAQWLGASVGTASQAMEEGNPIDRLIFSGLMILSIVVLMSRSFNWNRFFSRNFALIALIAFALVSAVWSDFPLVSAKRWFRDLGNYFVILVVFSDRRPFDAVVTVLRRLCYLLIPVSILMIKYYPNLGKVFSFWTGAAEFIGATTSKNMLGVLCLVSGIFFCWDTLNRWRDRKDKQTRKILILNGAFIWMTLWLLNLSNSATSTVCLAIGCLVLLAAHTKFSRRHPSFLKFMVPTSFCIYLILAFGLDINGDLAGAVGRDPTLTGRSDIWKAVLSTHTNPIVGAGYESFWLGDRLTVIWRSPAGHVNEAHNGYLELYLSLGLVGVSLLFALLVSSYRIICKKLSSLKLASLGLALWTVLLFYNMTESAAFKGQLLWVIFLLVVITVSVHSPIERDDRLPQTVTVKAFPNDVREGVAARDRVRPELVHGRMPRGAA
jgi:exopolysaccharide production protein ExoQ